MSIDVLNLCYSGRSSLIAERKNGTFNVRELSIFLEGNERNLKHKEAVMLEFERDSTFKVSDYPDLSRDEIRERTMAKVSRNRSPFTIVERICYLSVTSFLPF